MLAAASKTVYSLLSLGFQLLHKREVQILSILKIILHQHGTPDRVLSGAWEYAYTHLVFPWKVLTVQNQSNCSVQNCYQ